jgi:hypothetical protein
MALPVTVFYIAPQSNEIIKRITKEKEIEDKSLKC